jgi:hypothetical protein
MFWSIEQPSFFLDYLTLNIQAPRSFKQSVTAYQSTWLKNPDGLNLQQQLYDQFQISQLLLSLTLSYVCFWHYRQLTANETTLRADLLKSNCLTIYKVQNWTNLSVRILERVDECCCGQWVRGAEGRKKQEEQNYETNYFLCWLIKNE